LFCWKIRFIYLHHIYIVVSSASSSSLKGSFQTATALVFPKNLLDVPLPSANCKVFKPIGVFPVVSAIIKTPLT